MTYISILIHIYPTPYLSNTIFIQHHIYSIFQPIFHQINWCKRESWIFWPSCSLLELPGLIYDWPIPCQWRTLFANETRSALEYFYICCFILPRFSPPYNGILPRPMAWMHGARERWCIFSKPTASVARKSCIALYIAHQWQSSKCAQTISGGDQEAALASSYEEQEPERTYHQGIMYF